MHTQTFQVILAWKSGLSASSEAGSATEQPASSTFGFGCDVSYKEYRAWLSLTGDSLANLEAQEIERSHARKEWLIVHMESASFRKQSRPPKSRGAAETRNQPASAPSSVSELSLSVSEPPLVYEANRQPSSREV